MRNLLAAAALGAAAFALPAGAATIVNGSFETPGTPAGGYTQFGAGADIGGWTVFGDTSNAVILINNSYTEPGVAFPSQDGVNNLDLTGAGNTGANGVSQSVATVAGQIYTLSFFLGNATGDGTGNTPFYTLPASLIVSIDGVDTMFSNFATTPGSINWQNNTLTFTANDANTDIAFTNATQGDNYVGLDLVSIFAVPEPSTWLSLILGFGFIGGLLRRRRGETLSLRRVAA
jgi:hypothetical protein